MDPIHICDDIDRGTERMHIRRICLLGWNQHVLCVCVLVASRQVEHASRTKKRSVHHPSAENHRCAPSSAHTRALGSKHPGSGQCFCSQTRVAYGGGRVVASTGIRPTTAAAAARVSLSCRLHRNGNNLVRLLCSGIHVGHVSLSQRILCRLHHTPWYCGVQAVIKKV